MTRLASLLITAAMLLPAAAQAENGFYAGFGVGGARLEFDLADSGLTPPSDEPLASDSFAASDVAVKFFGGYRIMEFLAVEAAYLDLGEPRQADCFVDTAPDALAFCQSREWNTEVATDGWTLSAVGILPLGERWEAFAKAGVLFWEADGTALDQTTVPPNRPLPPDALYVSGNDDGTDLALGFGGTLKATDHIRLRGEFEWFDIENTSTAWLATLSAIYKF